MCNISQQLVDPSSTCDFSEMNHTSHLSPLRVKTASFFANCDVQAANSNSKTYGFGWNVFYAEPLQIHEYQRYMKKGTVLTMKMNEYIYEKSTKTVCLNGQQGKFLKSKVTCFFVCYVFVYLLSICQKRSTSVLYFSAIPCFSFQRSSNSPSSHKR